MLRYAYFSKTYRSIRWFYEGVIAAFLIIWESDWGFIVFFQEIATIIVSLKSLNTRGTSVWSIACKTHARASFTFYDIVHFRIYLVESWLTDFTFTLKVRNDETIATYKDVQISKTPLGCISDKAFKRQSKLYVIMLSQDCLKLVFLEFIGLPVTRKVISYYYLSRLERNLFGTENFITS